MKTYFILLLITNIIYASEPIQKCVASLNLLPNEYFKEEEYPFITFNTNGSNFFFDPDNADEIRIICENFHKPAPINRESTIQITYYEHENTIKKAIWNHADGLMATILVENNALLLNLFCIRTLDDYDYYFKNRIKYISASLAQEFVRKTSFYILPPFPNELTVRILFHTDVHFLFGVLPSVNKTLYNFISQCFGNINDDRKRFICLLTNVILNSVEQCDLPVKVFHDPRFSEELFLKTQQFPIKELLERASVKIFNKRIISLERHEERTPTETAELLKDCLRKGEQYAEQVIREQEKKASITCLNELEQLITYLCGKSNFAKAYKSLSKNLKKNKHSFNDIWTILSKNLYNDSPEVAYYKNMLKHFYSSNCFGLTLLIKQLFSDLEKDKATIIPSTFIKHVAREYSLCYKLNSSVLSPFQDLVESNVPFFSTILKEMYKDNNA